jgi:hypothetical protein
MIWNSSEVTLNKQRYNVTESRSVYQQQKQRRRTCFVVAVIIKALYVARAMFVFQMFQFVCIETPLEKLKFITPLPPPFKHHPFPRLYKEMIFGFAVIHCQRHKNYYQYSKLKINRGICMLENLITGDTQSIVLWLMPFNKFSIMFRL